MKTKLTLTFLFALFIGAYANGQENKNFHIKITTIENGKTFHIDTTFATREDMEAYLEKNDLPAVPEPPLPPAPADRPSKPRTPEPPAPPRSPKPPRTPDVPVDREIIIHIDGNELSKEEKEEIRIEMEHARKEMEKAMEEMNLDQKEMERAHEQMKLDEVEMEKAHKEMNRSQKEMEKEMKRMEIEIEETGEDGERMIIRKIGEGEGTGNYKMIRVDGEEYQSNGDKICIVKVYRDDEELKINTEGIENHGGPQKNDQEVRIIRKTNADGEPKEEMKMRSPMPENTADAENPSNEVAKPAASNKLAATDFKLYPNPTEGKINVSFRTEQPGPIHVKLLDSSGRVLVDEDVETSDGYFNKEYSIENKSRGAYLLQLKQGDQWRHEKIVVR